MSSSKVTRRVKMVRVPEAEALADTSLLPKLLDMPPEDATIMVRMSAMDALQQSKIALDDPAAGPITEFDVVPLILLAEIAIVALGTGSVHDLMERARKELPAAVSQMLFARTFDPSNPA